MRDMAENIGRHKLVALAVVIVIVAAGFALYEMNKKPENPVVPPSNHRAQNPEINSVYYPSSISTNSKLPIEINATADEVFVDMLINGDLHNYTANKTGSDFTLIVPVKEGVYEIEDIYAVKGNKSAKKEIDAVLKAFDKPVIHSVIYSKDMKPDETAKIELNATDTSGIAKALMLVTDPTGKKFHVSGKEEKGLYVFEFPLTKEPLYRFNISVSDPFNQTSYYNGSISSLDSPSINYFEIKKVPDKGIADIELKATDTSGIAKAVVQLNGENKSMTKLPNGSYAYNVFMGENPENLTLKVYVSDPFNQTSNVSGEIKWMLEDAFTYFGVKNGFNESEVEKFFNNYTSLIQKFYSLDKNGMIKTMRLWKDNATLLSKSDEIVEKNDAIKEKDRVLFDMAKSLYDVGKDELRDWSIWYLSNLTALEKEQANKKFEKLSDILNYTDKEKIALSGLGKEWINGSESEDLAYILLDNKNNSYLYPYAVWALAKQAAIISKWLGINYTDNLNYNGTSYSMREIVDKDFRKIANYTKAGKMILGLKPEELLNLLPSNKSNKGVIVDNWMREKLLPQAMFYTIWPEAIFAWEKYKGFIDWDSNGPPSGVGDNDSMFKVNTPNIALKVAIDNIKGFEKLHNDSVYLINHPDEEFQTGFVNRTAYQLVSDEITSMSNYFPNTTKEAWEDFKTLYHNGSKIAKIGILMYGKALADEFEYDVNNLGHSDEIRVEQAIGNLWSIGLPGYRGAISYPATPQHPTPGAHGSPSFIITPSDIQLLYNRSPEQLLMELDKKAFAYHIFASRVYTLSEDNSYVAFIFLPNLKIYKYYNALSQSQSAQR